MKTILACLLLAICTCSTVFAQDARDEKTRKLLELAAAKGNGLRTEIIVNGNVHAQAVLIPQVDAKRIFGNEIANNYAVIEVNVGNKSRDAALIIHGIFIDYREWPFSGATSSQLNAARSTDKYQESTFPNQVASEEYRIVRGQLLDAQTDTFRNTFLRWLTLAGNLAGAFTFSLNEQGIVKGIAAATGVGIPGIATAWPDKTIDQLNRVSDYGFRSNKVIPREGSDIIVCFFPIDRFLTKGFRKLFLKSPALFFAPGQMLMDKSVRKDVDAAIGNFMSDLGFPETDLKKDLPCFFRITHPVPDDPGYDVCLDDFGLQRAKDVSAGERRFELKHVGALPATPADIAKFRKFMALQFINSVSLNRVTITVDGVMAVDVKTIAARIDEVAIEPVDDCGDAGSQCLWTDITADSGIRRGVIRGSYLTNGDLKIAEAAALHLDELKKIPEASNEQELYFSFKLSAPVPNQTKLHFVVTKPADSVGAKPLESNAFEYLVAYSPSATPISAADLDSDTAPTTVTVQGAGFDSTMAVTLLSESGEKRPVTVPKADIKKDQFVVTLPIGAKALKAGCWSVQVQAGGLFSNRSEKFAIPPKPTLSSAVRNDKFILVKGKDLIDFSHCGGQQVSFQMIQGATTVSLEVADWNNGQPVLILPETGKEGTWKVQVLLNETLVTPNGEVELKKIP